MFTDHVQHFVCGPFSRPAFSGFCSIPYPSGKVLKRYSGINDISDLRMKAKEYRQILPGFLKIASSLDIIDPKPVQKLLVDF